MNCIQWWVSVPCFVITAQQLTKIGKTDSGIVLTYVTYPFIIHASIIFLIWFLINFLFMEHYWTYWSSFSKSEALILLNFKKQVEGPHMCDALFSRLAFFNTLLFIIGYFISYSNFRVFRQVSITGSLLFLLIKTMRCIHNWLVRELSPKLTG